LLKPLRNITIIDQSHPEGIYVRCWHEDEAFLKSIKVGQVLALNGAYAKHFRGAKGLNTNDDPE